MAGILGAFQQLHALLNAGAAIAFVFKGGRDSQCLAQVFLRQAHKPRAIAGPFPVKTFNNQDTFATKARNVRIGGGQSKGLQNLETEPLVFAAVAQIYVAVLQKTNR